MGSSPATRTKNREAPCASPDFCVIVFVEGLEKGGGTAVKNSPVDCFSARGKVPQSGQSPSELKNYVKLLTKEKEYYIFLLPVYSNACMEQNAMTIKQLSEINYRYVRIRIDGDSTRYENINFTNLLKFIGENYPINNRDPIGCAYKIIQKETDKLLKVSWGSNWNLKTSKREVSSIRQAKYWLLERQENHYYIRIPYKISFIFSAIISIVNEIKKTKPIPHELANCVGAVYGASFYAFHMDQYDRMYRNQFRDAARLYDARQNPALLYDEFHSPNSIFSCLFQ